jgi:hypothetical protein
VIVSDYPNTISLWYLKTYKFKQKKSGELSPAFFLYFLL